MKKCFLFIFLVGSTLLYSQRCYKYVDSEKEFPLILSDDYKYSFFSIGELVGFGEIEYKEKKNRYYLPPVLDVRLKLSFELLADEGLQLLINGIRGEKGVSVECSSDDKELFRLLMAKYIKE